jgi:DNA-binding NarL/FixJ family response regulator
MLAARQDLSCLAALGAVLRKIGEGSDHNTASAVAAAAEALSRLCARGPRFEAIVGLAMIASAARSSPSVQAALAAGGLAAPRALFPQSLGALAEFDAIAGRGQSHAPARQSFGLTRREVEVARLLADGLTNREMASRLSLSVRTVETHVDRILGKLGVSSRTRAASMTARLGLI